MTKSNETKSQSKKQQKCTSIRISSETQKQLDRVLAIANKKPCGRKIFADQVLGLAIGLVTADHIKMLQEQSLSNADRMEQLRQSYIQNCGPMSREEFFGFVLSGDFQTFLATQRTAQIVAPTISDQRAS